MNQQSSLARVQPSAGQPVPAYGLPENGAQAASTRTMRPTRYSRASEWSRTTVKRLFDGIGSAMLLLAFSPLFLVVAISVKRAGGGPVFFSQVRVGRNGTHFRVLKFRSMVPNAEEVLKELLARDPEAAAEWAKDRKLKQDPRVTPIGGFLRKTSLDELPQLVNVLKGEMSLVGPRPVVPDELSCYGRASRYYLASKPGMTGLWQVTGRNDTDYSRRVALDRTYAERGSFWMDLRILWQTLWVVLKNDGAY